MPFTAMAGSSTITPRIDIYTTIACSFLRPDYGESPLQHADILGFLHSKNDFHGVAHHQSSCVDISGVFMVDKSLLTNGMDTPARKQRCASDPVVQAAVAKLTSCEYRIGNFFFFLCASTCIRLVFVMLDDDNHFFDD